jgi:HEAT repeat protein
VATVQMLRADKKRADDISKQLKDPDLERLLDAAADPDRTVRIYATEFLFDLGNKTVRQKAIKRAAQTNDDTARYQWLFAAQGGWGDLNKSEKTELAPLLQQAKDKASARTRALFDKLS